ncbi:3'-5' RNA exonuclease complex component [Rhizina undulata]
MPLLARFPSRASIHLALLRKSIPTSSTANLVARRPICISLRRFGTAGDNKGQDGSGDAHSIADASIESDPQILKKNIEETQVSLLEDIGEEDLIYTDNFREPKEPVDELTPVYPGPIPIEATPIVPQPRSPIPAPIDETRVVRPVTTDIKRDTPEAVVRRVENETPLIRRQYIPSTKGSLIWKHGALAQKILRDRTENSPQIRLVYKMDNQMDRVDYARAAQERKKEKLESESQFHLRRILDLPLLHDTNVQNILSTPPSMPVLFQHPTGEVVRVPKTLAIDKVVSEIEFFAHRVERTLYRSVTRALKEQRMAKYPPAPRIRYFAVDDSKRGIPEGREERGVALEVPTVESPLIRHHLFDDKKAIDLGAPADRYDSVFAPFRRVKLNSTVETPANGNEGEATVESEQAPIEETSEVRRAGVATPAAGPLGTATRPSISSTAPVFIPGSQREFSTFSRFLAQEQTQVDAEKRGKPQEPSAIREKYTKIEQEKLKAIGMPVPITNTKIFPGGPRNGFEDNPEDENELRDLEDIGSMMKLKKGDLCEVRTRAGIELGIYLRPTKGGEATLDILCADGTMVRVQEPRISFSVESKVAEAEVDKFLAYHDLWDIKGENIHPPRSLSTNITSFLKSFNEAFMAAYQSKLHRFEELYNRLAHDVEMTLVTLDEAAKQVFGEHPSDAELYATHYALMGDGTRYLAARGKHRTTSTFKVRSKQALQMIDDVTEWIRRTGSKNAQKMSPADLELVLARINGFVEKAKYVIDLNREQRKPENKPADGKLIEILERTEVRWDEHDRFFIEYMKARVLKYGLQHLPLDGLVPSVLKMTERYQGEILDANAAYNFLREIGVWSPWENTSLMKTSLDLPGPHLSKSGRLDETKLGRFSEKDFKQLNDSMADYRKDWGDLEIYAVDDATAEEIDDAISIEEKNGETWIHAHIANPTSHIPHDHWIADIAAKKTASVYLPERSIPMLPELIAKKHLGLDKNRPVLSISSKIGSDGEVLDVKVQPGFARNLKRITYPQMNRVLGISTEGYRDVIEVGEMPNDKKGIEESPLTENDIANLQRFQAIAQKLRSRRVRDGFIAVNQPNLEVQVSDGMGNYPHRHYHKHPILYRGHPAIRLSVDTDPEASDSAAMSIIAEFMLHTNGVIAKWCKERKIPVPFRVQEYDKTRTDVYEALMTKVLPTRNERGVPDVADTLRYLMLLGGTRLEATPGPHMILGMPGGYVKATSPLRRYSDMITHWQIESFLRNEALAFSQSHLETFLPKNIIAEKEIRFMDQDSKRFWAAAAIQRSLEEGRVLKRRYTMVITEKKLWPTPSTGKIRELNLLGKVRFQDAAAAKHLENGDVVSVEIEQVRLGESMVWYKMLDIVEKGAFKVTL